MNFQFSTPTLVCSPITIFFSAGTTGMPNSRSHNLSAPLSRSSSKGLEASEKISMIRCGNNNQVAEEEKKMCKTSSRRQFWRCWESAVVVDFCWKANEEFSFHSIISKMFVSYCVLQKPVQRYSKKISLRCFDSQKVVVVS